MSRKRSKPHIVGLSEPRWGRVSKETLEKRAAWSDYVGSTEPTPLRKCSECGGWATRKCVHQRM